MSCNPPKIDQNFGEKKSFFQVRNISHVRIQHETMLALCFMLICLLRIIPLPWRWRRNIPSKHLLLFHSVHGVMSHKPVITICMHARFQVFTAVAMKKAVFWDIKLSLYLTGDTLLLRYRAQSVNAMYDFRFSRRWLWRMPSSWMLRRVALMRTDIRLKFRFLK
jgi:hypothetical protein